jgi:ABC-type phosphate transport system ATPase subunit
METIEAAASMVSIEAAADLVYSNQTWLSWSIKRLKDCGRLTALRRLRKSGCGKTTFLQILSMMNQLYSLHKSAYISSSR